MSDCPVGAQITLRGLWSYPRFRRLIATGRVRLGATDSTRIRFRSEQR